MAVQFGGNPIFGDALTRVQEGPIGDRLLERWTVTPEVPGVIVIGAMEERVIVRGRLRASDRAALLSRIDDVRAALSTSGKLSDGFGREWDDLRFTSFVAEPTIDQGREVSVGFVATFVQIAAV